MTSVSANRSDESFEPTNPLLHAKFPPVCPSGSHLFRHWQSSSADWCYIFMIFFCFMLMRHCKFAAFSRMSSPEWSKSRWEFLFCFVVIASNDVASWNRFFSVQFRPPWSSDSAPSAIPHLTSIITFYTTDCLLPFDPLRRRLVDPPAARNAWFIRG